MVSRISSYMYSITNKKIKITHNDNGDILEAMRMSQFYDEEKIFLSHPQYYWLTFRLLCTSISRFI